jgi:hypothetical protein
VFGNGPNPLLDVVPSHPQGGTIGSESTDHNVNMGMFGIEVFYRYPIELGSKIFLHPLHQIACQPLQIGSVSELGRDNHLPESRVFCLLPFIQSSGNIDALISGGESNQSRILLLGSTLPRQVPAVCLPLSARLVVEIGNSDGTAL